MLFSAVPPDLCECLDSVCSILNLSCLNYGWLCELKWTNRSKIRNISQWQAQLARLAVNKLRGLLSRGIRFVNDILGSCNPVTPPHLWWHFLYFWEKATEIVDHVVYGYVSHGWRRNARGLHDWCFLRSTECRAERGKLWILKSRMCKMLICHRKISLFSFTVWCSTHMSIRL